VRDPIQSGLSTERLIKLACLLEMVGLQDQAVEAILEAQSAGPLSVEEACDRLAKGWWPQFPSYQAVLEAFSKDPLRFGKRPLNKRDMLRNWLRKLRAKTR
jgi:hypothetical protein